MSNISSTSSAPRCVRSSLREAARRALRRVGARNNIMLGLSDKWVIVLGGGKAIVGLELCRFSAQHRVDRRYLRRSWIMTTRRPAQKLLTGLIGSPIAHSASPAMHERAAEALGLRGHYQLIEVAGADTAGLRMMLEGVRR